MKRVPALLLVSLLAACDGKGNCVRLGPGASYCLSDAPGPRFDTEQASAVNYADNTVHMIARIRSDEGGLHFAGVTPLGQTLLQVSAGRQGLTSQLPPDMQGKVDGAMFAALVQLAAWPAEEVRRGLRGGLTLLELPGRRSILHGEETLLTIAWEGKEPPYEALRVDIPAVRVRVESRALDTSNTLDKDDAP
jgi:hypothetical protein